MKLLVQDQIWDFHQIKILTKITDDLDVIYSYRITTFTDEDWNDSEIKVEEIYVYPEYRNQGYFNEIMNNIHTEFLDKNIFIIVKRNYWLVEKYEKLGYEYWKEYNDDFDWMVKFQKILLEKKT